MSCEGYLTSKGKPKNKIDCVAWLLLNVFGCKFCETCRDKPCNIKDGEFCTDNIANYIREAVKEENKTVADVVEVRHSQIKWVNRPISAQYATVTDENGEKHYGKVCDRIENNTVGYCGECGKRLDDTFMNYCPNCGAKMDGERKEQ